MKSLNLILSVLTSFLLLHTAEAQAILAEDQDHEGWTISTRTGDNPGGKIVTNEKHTISRSSANTSYSSKVPVKDVIGNSPGFATKTASSALNDITDRGLVSGGANSWYFHTPDDGRTTMYVAPGVNGANWDWAKAFRFRVIQGDSDISLRLPGRIHSTGQYPGIWLGTDYKGFIGRSPASNTIGFYTNSTNTISKWALNVDLNTGNVGVGTASIPGDYKLAVRGKVITEEVHLQLFTEWPDYVFDAEYTLMPLAKVENYIHTHGHLPNIPSAEEVKAAEGFDAGDMMQKLLQKVEELTLYTIHQQKLIEKQQKEINGLKKTK